MLLRYLLAGALLLASASAWAQETTVRTVGSVGQVPASQIQVKVSGVVQPLGTWLAGSGLVIGTTGISGCGTNGFVLYNNAGFLGCEAVSGVGTVTSVALTAPAIFTIAGSPVTTAGTLGLVAAGTSGGVPYFDSTTSLASSGLLTNHALVLGGGAGAAPKVVASLGTSTTVLHGAAAGDPTFGAVSLTADVSDTLPVGNGGTGAASLLANAILIGNGTSPISGDGSGSTLTTGILSVLGLTGSSSAPFRISTNNAANQMLFKFGGQGGSNTLIMSSTQILPQKTTAYGYPTTVIPTRAWDTTTDGIINFNSNLSGTVTGAPQVQPINLQTTMNIAGALTSALMRLTLSDGAAASTNYYVIDSSMQCGVTPTSGEKECHAGRFTASTNNQGGTIGTPLGGTIGLKAASAIPLGGGNNYMRAGIGLEVLALNADPTTLDNIGLSIVAGASVGTTRNDDGINFNGTYGGAGKFTKYLINLMGTGLLAPLATTGTAIGAGDTMTITHGIDLHNLTMTGKAYNDGKASIDGPTGNIVTTGTISGTGSGLTGIPTSALTGTMTDPVCATWDSTTAVTAQTTTFPAAWATYTITSVKARVSGGGSFTYAMQIGGTPVTGCNGVTVNSSSNVNTSCTAANTGVVNDIISMVIASPSGTVNTAYVCPVFTHSVN